MLRNYFRIAFRNLVRNRLSSAINIGGLAIGMSVAILIGLWIFDELSFDKVHDNYDRIASVMQNQVISGHVQTWRSEALQLAPSLRKDFGADFKYVVTGTGTWQHLLTVGEKKLKYTGSYMEAPIIDVLSLKMLQGNQRSLDDPSSIILSVSAARGLFGDDAAMGKALRLDNSHSLTVTGIYADLPANSSFTDLQFIAPFANLVHSEGYDTTLGWGNSWFETYVQLNEHVDRSRASAAIREVKADHSPGDRRFKPTLFLHPMSRWRLYSDFEDGISASGRIRYVRLFAIIGVFVLLLACINFMNLSTARSEKRAKEVGIRKAIGSMRGQLIRQFFSESLVIALLAFVLAIGLVQLLLPFFNEVADKKMSIPWGRSLFWLAGLCFTLITGLLAGSYPALYLSSFRPEKVLKGTFRVGRMASMPRKVLVVLQFAVSVILVVGTLAVFRQIQYAKDRPAGYSRDGLITVPLQSFKAAPHLEALRSDLQQSGFVEGIAGSESSPANTWITNSGFDWPGKDPSLQEEFTTNGVTPDFGRVAGWQIAEGRDFSRDYSTDSTSSASVGAASPRSSSPVTFAGSVIINETAAKYMGLRHPVGQEVRWGNNGRFTIIGVIKDMVAQTPYDPVTPMIFYMSSSLSFSHLGVIDIRLRPEAGMARALAAIGAIFKKYDPDDPFEYRFADEEYAKKFGDEERVGRLAGFFTILAIIISCLGLLGLSSFVAEQRTREIGVRKILGASVFHLWQLLSREFVALVSVALLIGGPIAWWIMKGWLAGYRYHAGLSWRVFAFAALGAIGITLFTVSFQAIRAALANPVKSLRSE